MKFLVFILIVALFFSVPFIFVAVRKWRDDIDRERTGSEDPRARDIRLNHAAMARLLDHLLNDDMTRVMIPEDQQEAARTLLANYYQDGAAK